MRRVIGWRWESRWKIRTNTWAETPEEVRSPCPARSVRTARRSWTMRRTSARPIPRTRRLRFIPTSSSTSRLHFEIGGVERTFKVFNSNTTGLGAQQTFTAQGGGLLFGASGELFKGFRVISTNFLSDGGGRYLFGQAPDVAVRSDGSLSPIHADGTVDGIEFTRGTWQFFAYYGGIYIGRDALLDANGTTRIGYGFAGSPNSQNRALNEITWGFVRTFWKNPRLGALSLIGQYEYMLRDPWYVAAGAPKSAHDNTVYLNLRYTLPGQAPVFK